MSLLSSFFTNHCRIVLLSLPLTQSLFSVQKPVPVKIVQTCTHSPSPPQCRPLFRVPYYENGSFTLISLLGSGSFLATGAGLRFRLHIFLKLYSGDLLNVLPYLVCHSTIPSSVENQIDQSSITMGFDGRREKERGDRWVTPETRRY